MKVKLLISRAGSDFAQNAGDIVEVGEAEARRMVEAGQAEPVSVKETATKKITARKAVKE